MSATVQSMLVKLHQRIDPYTADGTEITSSNVGSVDGHAITKQRMVDIYNEARITLASALKGQMSGSQLSEVAGGIVKSATLAWASQVATVPSDYIDLISMRSSTNVPMYRIASTLIPESVSGANTHLTATATNLVFFEYRTGNTSTGHQFVFLGTASLLPNQNSTIVYVAVPTITLSDVTGGTVYESFNDKYHTMILDLAEALALEQGNAEVMALAQKLLGGK